MNIDLESLRQRWDCERPQYEEFRRAVEEKLRIATTSRSIGCIITSRTKEMDSLLKKAMRKEYNDPFNDISDKVGVRIVCTYKDTLTQLEDIVRDQFEVCDYENKTAENPHDRLGYSGIHFEVKYQTNYCGEENSFDGLICEVQLLTRAQSIWADISH